MEGGTSEGASTSQWGLWGLANAVSSSLKTRAGELVKTIESTDWKSELAAFRQEAAVESKAITHKTAELMEHLPDLESLSIQAEQGAAHPRLTRVGEFLTGSSISTFGQSLLTGTQELIEQVCDAVESEIAVATREGKRSGRGVRSAKGVAAAAAKLAAAGKYSRGEAEVIAMQRDPTTYCDEPTDAEEYARWKAGFSTTAAQTDIQELLAENGFMAELQARLVPTVVEREDFWMRYFFRLSKLHQKAEARAALKQRTLASQQEELTGWDIEEPGEEAPAAEVALSHESKPSSMAEADLVMNPTPVTTPTLAPTTPSGLDPSTHVQSAGKQPADQLPILSPSALLALARSSAAQHPAPAEDVLHEASVPLHAAGVELQGYDGEGIEVRGSQHLKPREQDDALLADAVPFQTDSRAGSADGAHGDTQAITAGSEEEVVAAVNSAPTPISSSAGSSALDEAVTAESASSSSSRWCVVTEAAQGGSRRSSPLSMQHEQGGEHHEQGGEQQWDEHDQHHLETPDQGGMTSGEDVKGPQVEESGTGPSPALPASPVHSAPKPVDRPKAPSALEPKGIKEHEPEEEDTWGDWD